MVHLADASSHNEIILIKTVDTDVVGQSVAAMVHCPITELWVLFGAGKHFPFMPCM